MNSEAASSMSAETASPARTWRQRWRWMERSRWFSPIKIKGRELNAGRVEADRRRRRFVICLMETFLLPSAAPPAFTANMERFSSLIT